MHNTALQDFGNLLITLPIRFHSHFQVQIGHGFTTSGHGTLNTGVQLVRLLTESTYHCSIIESIFYVYMITSRSRIASSIITTAALVALALSQFFCAVYRKSVQVANLGYANRNSCINAKNSLRLTARVVTSNIKNYTYEDGQKQLTSEKGNGNCLF